MVDVLVNLKMNDGDVVFPEKIINTYADYRRYTIHRFLF